MTDESVIQAAKQEASRLLEAGQVQDALPLIRQAAHWGDIESQMLAADIYSQGLYGVQANPYAAFEYVKLAAMNDQPYYMYELGDMFLNGAGTNADAQKAFYFLNKAANREVKAAYDPLSMLYVNGRGTEKDLDKALYWNGKALEEYPEDLTVQKHARMIEKLRQKHGI